MFEKIKQKLIDLRLGLADFEQRVVAGVFHGQPNVMAQHVALNVKAMVGTVSEVHDALVAYETQTNNAVALLDEDVKTLKLAVTALQDALTDPAVAAEIVRVRTEAKAAAVAEAEAQGAAHGPAAEAKVGTGG